MLRSLPAIALLSTAQVSAQDRPLPYPVTPPLEFSRAVERGTQTMTGEPGPRYWQQWTDYVLEARLDPAAKRVTGRARILYHNRSPDTLRVVFTHLLQNLHAEGAVRNEPQEVTGGIALARVVAGGRALSERPLNLGPGYEALGTVMAIRPPAPVPPGGALPVEIDWSFTVPQSGAGRMGWNDDNLFFIAYWYPQMAVYDDVVGWHVDPYLGGAEFHAGFGSYDVTVEAPEGWLVAATGRLENAAEVLPAPIRERLARAEQSDSVVHVLSPNDLGPGRATMRGLGRPLRWHFVADTVRDFAFSATLASRWDAARTPAGDRWVRVDAIWRDRAPRWRHTWRYAQHSIDFLSRWTGLPYPWPHMTAVEGGGIIGGGMEFPMMTLMGDYNERGDSALYYVTAHELAHMWVPMMVATDEKRRAWMDEGTTTFNENQARKEFFPGVNHDEGDRDSYLAVARADLEGELMRWSDYHYPGPAYGVASYSKPATLLATLRALVGEEVFTRAYRTYLRRWRYRHPKPWDFFNAFNQLTERSLDWFWRSWYYETWTLDQAVASVTISGNRATVTLVDRGSVPMPVRLVVTFADGRTATHEVPVDVWLAGTRTHTMTIESDQPVVRVEIDPERLFPDVDRSNNRWNSER